MRPGAVALRGQRGNACGRARRPTPAARARQVTRELQDKQQASAANAATLTAFGAGAKWDRWANRGKKGGAGAAAAAAATAAGAATPPASGPAGAAPPASAAAAAAAQLAAAAAATAGGAPGGAAAARTGSGAAAAAGGGGAGLPQRAGPRVLRLRDLVAALEHEPMYAKSVLLYQLYEQLP